MLAWPSSPLPRKQKKQEDHLRSSCLSNSASNGQLLPSHRLSRVPSVSCAHTLSHSGFHSAKMTWPSRFLEDPNACMPCSSTPAQPWHSCCLMPGCCLPQEARRRLPQRIFRDSITRPTDPLCTLRSLGYPRTTQHSIPAASRQPAIETAGKRQSGPRPTYRLSGWNGGVTVYVRGVANNA